MTFRTVDSLKKYWGNVKEDLRKRMGNNRRSLYMTGGGTPSPSDSRPDDDVIMSIVNKKVITGISNTFDDDVLEDEVQENIQEESLHESPPKSPDIEEIGNLNFSWPENSNVEIQIENMEERQVNENILPVQARPKSLKIPLNGTLRKNIKTVRNNTAVTLPGTSKDIPRRRPRTIRLLSSSILGEKYGNLIDKKLELAECLKKEHSMRMKLLTYDVALKEKELAAAGIDKTDIMLLEAAELML